MIIFRYDSELYKECSVTEKEIRDGLDLLGIGDNTGALNANIVKNDDVFTAYRNFSAYEPSPTTYSGGTSLHCNNVKQLDNHKAQH